jgi:hypothetical protein
VSSGPVPERSIQTNDFIHISASKFNPKLDQFQINDAETLSVMRESDLIIVDYGKVVLEVIKVTKRQSLNRSNSISGIEVKSPPTRLTEIKTEVDILETKYESVSPF